MKTNLTEIYRIRAEQIDSLRAKIKVMELPEVLRELESRNNRIWKDNALRDRLKELDADEYERQFGDF